VGTGKRLDDAGPTQEGKGSMNLIQELRAKGDATRRQQQAEREVASRYGKGTFMDDCRYIAAITQGRRVKA
jgi:hypothetical protein